MKFTSFHNIFSFLCLLSFMLIQCQSADSELDNLYKEVVSMHDEVMPQTYYIRTLKSKLSEIEKSETLDTFQVDSLNRIMLDLKIAEDAMWDWMHSFDDNYGKLISNEEKTNYLLKEKESMLFVEKITISSINDAEQLLIKWQ